MRDLSAMLATVVRAVRLRYALLFLALLVAVYWTGIRPWMANWGSNAAEQQLVLPGDGANTARSGQPTLAITIDAPPEVVWPWLVQVGQDRAGFYSYTWLENLIGCDIHNTDEIRPEWQHLAVGDSWRLAPRDYLWGVGEGAATPVLSIEPGRALVLEMWGAFVIEPLDGQTSRLLVRGQSGSSGPVASLASKLIMDPLVFTMERRMLLGIKARAEDQPESPAALAALAQLGWVAAGVAVAWLFASQRRRRYWLTLPVMAALPALLMAGDIQAGLAAFLAVGITALGFLAYGRNWWGPLLIVGPIVMLTLLLAPDAYVAIGLAFTLPLVAAVALVAARPGTRTDAPRRPAAAERLRQATEPGQAREEAIMTTLQAFIKRHPTPLYSILTFIISWGGFFLVIGPGRLSTTDDPLFLVALVVTLAGPSLSGLLLTGLVQGRAGFRDLRDRLLRWRVGVGWYALALLTAPLLTMVALLALSLHSAEFRPGIFATDNLASLLLTGLASAPLVAFLEELGWTGFAIPLLRRRHGVLATGMIVGLLWGAWHFPMFWGSDTFSGTLPLALLIVRLFSWLPAYRLLMVWAYDRTGSLPVVLLMHASLVANQVVLLPASLSLAATVVSTLAWAALLWVLVATIGLADGGQFARRALQRRVA